MLSGVRRRSLSLAETGVDIAVLDWGGDGPLALLHHANGFCAALWAPVAEPLRDRYRVVAMDARGHGDSSKPESADAYQWAWFGRDLAGVAKRLADESSDGRVELGIGHSFGGTSMLMAAASNPELFGRLVLVDPVILPPPDVMASVPSEDRPDLAGAARNRRVVWPSREAAKQKWRRRALFSRWTERALDLYVDEGMRERPDGQVELKCPGEIEAAVFDNNQSVDLWSLAASIRIPVLFLWASQGSFPRAVYEQMASSMPDARVEELDAGHLVTMERPDLVVDAVLRFADSNL